jgi:thioredoxin 1
LGLQNVTSFIRSYPKLKVTACFYCKNIFIYVNLCSLKTYNMIEHLTAESFKQKVFDYEKNTDWKFEGDKPCLVDFYADWCQPCRMVAPILEELAEEFTGKMNIYKVDTEDQKELASVFGIQSIPSLLFIPAQGQPQMAKGALPKESFKQIFKEVLIVE